MAVKGLYVMPSKRAAKSLRLSVKPCGKKARQSAVGCRTTQMKKGAIQRIAPSFQQEFVIPGIVAGSGPEWSPSVS